MRLSICIPTHDGRARRLAVALDSVLEQLTPELEGVVEVCISDNGSEDGTRELVERRVGMRPAVLRYQRFESNQGFTTNLLAVVEQSRGDFCWLFSSDDALVPDGLGRVLRLIERHPDATGATLVPVLYDLDRRVPAARPLWPQPTPSRADREHRWTSAHDAVAQAGLYMGILPAQLIRREAWQNAVAEVTVETLRETPLFPHLAIIYRMILRQPVWVWYPEATFHLRVGAPNSVLSGGGGRLTRYHLETTVEQVGIWRALFGRGATLHALLRGCMQAVFNPVALVSYKAQQGQTLADDLRLAAGTARWFWRFPAFWLLRAPVLLLPGVALGLVVRPLIEPIRRLATRSSGG